MTTSFTHLEPGTAEASWWKDGRMTALPELEIGAVDLVVVAAHPDDETLGAAGLIQRVHQRGGRITVVLATDGEGSHPNSPTHSPRELAALRRREAEAAISSLSPDAAVYHLGLVDGTLRENAAVLGTALDGVLDARGIGSNSRFDALVVAPWSGDGHRDHRVLAEVTGGVARRRGLRHLGYPIWAWHWAGSEQMPWSRAHALRLGECEQWAKSGAIDLHASQVSALSPLAGDEPVVHAGMRAHFERELEVFIDETDAAGATGDGETAIPAVGAHDPGAGSATLPASYFTDFYRRHDDPWGFETRWYEQRKREILLASFPAAHLGTVLEIGCSTGHITARLRDRADRVVAVDPVESVLAAARERLGDDGRVDFVRAEIPHDWPEGRFDTIVLSEVLYYLSADDLDRTIERLQRSLAPGGVIAACHWRHEVRDYPQTGDAVHDRLRSVPTWDALVRHDEADFLLEVFTRTPARSVAQREGLV